MHHASNANYVKADSHDVRLTYAGAAEVCVAAKIRKSSIFTQHTCLPHPHASNAHHVNEPLHPFQCTFLLVFTSTLSIRPVVNPYSNNSALRYTQELDREWRAQQQQQQQQHQQQQQQANHQQYQRLLYGKMLF